MPLILIGRVFFTMSYTEKIDVLDMIITILREHEAKIDELVSRLEAAVDKMGASAPEDELARGLYEPL